MDELCKVTTIYGMIGMWVVARDRLSHYERCVV